MKIVLPIHYTIDYKTKKSKKILVWMNAYRNWHFHLSNKIKKYYYDLISEQLEWNKELYEWIKPTYTVYVWNKLTDWGNVRSVIEKFFLDTLVEKWIIKNDTCDYVIWDSSEYFIDKSNPRIEIEI